MTSSGNSIRGRWIGYQDCDEHNNTRSITLDIRLDGIHLTATGEVDTGGLAWKLDLAGFYDSASGDLQLEGPAICGDMIETDRLRGRHEGNFIHGTWGDPSPECHGKFTMELLFPDDTCPNGQ